MYRNQAGKALRSREVNVAASRVSSVRGTAINGRASNASTLDAKRKQQDSCTFHNDAEKEITAAATSCTKKGKKDESLCPLLKLLDSRGSSKANVLLGEYSCDGERERPMTPQSLTAN